MSQAFLRHPGDNGLHRLARMSDDRTTTPYDGAHGALARGHGHRSYPIRPGGGFAVRSAPARETGVEKLALRPDDPLPSEHQPERRGDLQVMPNLGVEQVDEQAAEVGRIRGPRPTASRCVPPAAVRGPRP